MRTKWGFVLMCVGLTLLTGLAATDSDAQTPGDKMKPEKEDKVGGSGTAGFLPKFLSKDTIGDSVLFESDSGNVGVGFSDPERKFEVFGTVGFHYGTTENGSSVVWINQFGDPPEGGFNVGLSVTTGGNEETGESIAIWGISNSPNEAAGVQGTGRVGVFGDSHLNSGVGVGAYASSFTGETRGVLGVVESSEGTAGQFENNAGGTILRGFGAGHTEVFNVAGDGTVSAAAFVGDGSGLTGITIGDADTLDGVDSSQFARLDSPNLFTGSQSAEDFLATNSIQGQSAFFSGGTSINQNSVVFIDQGADPPDGGFNLALKATAYGISEAGETIGVWGISNNPHSGFGVQGSSGGRGFGVFGDSANGIGVGGYAISATEETRGVVGVVDSPNGIAGEFQNNGGGTVLLGGAGQVEVFRVDGDGTVTATDFVETSSLREKINIAELQNPLERVQQLRGISYHRRADGRNSIGLIAEEVALLVPEIVELNASGEPRGLNYGRLTALLIEAMKEQQRQISDLRSEIQTLKGIQSAECQ